MVRECMEKTVWCSDGTPAEALLPVNGAHATSNVISAGG